MASVRECGCGHKIIDDDKIIYTSQAAMAYDIETLTIVLDMALSWLSEILDIPTSEIYQDFYDLSGRNMMLESMNAVLRKQGRYHKIPTITEQSFALVKECLKQKMPEFSTVENVRNILNRVDAECE